MNTVRMNITLSKPVADKLRSLLGKRGISKFISEATEEKLEKEKRELAFKKLAKLPPANPEIKDSAKYIHDMRQEDTKHRMAKLGQI